MSNETKASEWQKRECGALWKKESPTQKYYSGHVKVDDNGEEKLVRVVVFSNRHKTKDNHPDMRIYTVEDKTDSQPKAQESQPALADEEVL